QGGILASIFGYMLYIQPALALFSLLVFSPQFVFVPLLQAAINRRVEARVRISRELSHGIVKQGSARSAHDPAQWRRVNQVFHLHMGMFKLKFTMNFLMNFTHHAGVAAALVIGGWFVVRGEA